MPIRQVEESVTMWIDRLKGGDPQSAQELWQRYFHRLVQLAGQKLPIYGPAHFDEEDVALSAFHSLCRGVAAGRFPELNDRQNLWSLLVVITARKAIHQLRDAFAKKRGGPPPQAADHTAANALDVDQIIGKEPTPEFACQVAEETERLLEILPDQAARELVLLKMQGHTNAEVSQRLGCGLRTVERRLGMVRTLWSRDAELGDDAP